MGKVFWQALCTASAAQSAGGTLHGHFHARSNPHENIAESFPAPAETGSNLKTKLLRKLV